MDRPKFTKIENEDEFTHQKDIAIKFYPNTFTDTYRVISQPHMAVY